MKNCIVLNGKTTELTEAQVESIRRAFVTDEISSDSREKKFPTLKKVKPSESAQRTCLS